MKTSLGFAGFALISLLAATACGPVAVPRLPGAATATSVPRTAPTVQADNPTTVPTPLVGPAPIVETCPPGQVPVFLFGFAGLKERLGERMGDPVSCERPGPEGDALQQTTTGMARYRKATNIPSFTSGDEHWALTDRGLLHWLGRALDPPDTAQILDGDTAALSPAHEIPGPVPATPSASSDLIALPPEPAADILPDAPAWVQPAAALLKEYDRRNATVLVEVIQRTGISVSRLRDAGAWGLFVPGSHRIMLDASLADESPQAVAAVLGHEADHARDTLQYGPPRTQAACYSFEITAFVLEARIWAATAGPAGKPHPQTDLEDELNLILATSHTNPGTLMSAIKESYQAECG